jgi:hypothetical protein
MGNIVSSVLEPFTGAKATRRAADQAAQQQTEAARLAAISSAFRPVGMTTRFGTSQFTTETDPETGLPRVTAGGYTVAPELRALQDRLMGLTGGALTTAEEAQMAAAPVGAAAQQAFNLGTQYLGETPEAVRQRYIAQQQALLEPTRAREEQRLASSVFGRGRAGLNVGDIGQPELRALAEARRTQDLQLAAQAEQAAQQQIGFGSSLFGTGASLLGQQYAIPTQALAPLQSTLGTVQSIEQLGQDPYNLGLQLGGLVTQGSQAGGQLLGAGMSQAAQTRYQGVQQANAANAAFLQAALGAASGGFGGGGGSSIGNFFGNPLTAMKYGTNIGSQQTRMLADQDRYF